MIFKGLIVIAALLINDPVPKKTTTAVNKSLVLELVNKVRKNGCQCGDTYYPPAPPLAWNEKLEQAALAHSADMQRRNYFSHTSPEGTRAGARLQQAGYRWKAFGENIAFGYRNEKEVVEGWIKSAGHCKNLMNKTFAEMALARAGNYWTQTFGQR